jgi:thiamine biosynthesis lipoprotein
MRTNSLAPVLVALLALLTLGCRAPDTKPSITTLTGPTMGTLYTVKVAATGLAQARQDEVQAAVQAELDDVNAKMSHYLEDSELSRLNRWTEPEPFPVSAETLEVLQHAAEVSAFTDGAFDVTVGPLVNAWGFGPPGRPAETPAAEQIEHLLAATGWELVGLDANTSTVRKGHPELTLDLSAIAKGYGVDRVAARLDMEGIENYMIEIGGEVRTRGLNEQGAPWRIAIERPEIGRRALQLVVPLSELSMATSGDYRNYYEVDGRRLSHTIDPRTGWPITHNVASVSVVHEQCVRADALATALLVLGPDGFDLAEKLGLWAYFLTRQPDGGFSERMTPQFAALLD